MNEKLYNRIELGIFEQILKGDIRPNNQRNERVENLRDLVKKVNKRKVVFKDELSSESPKSLVNYKSLGYYSEDDFNIIPEVAGKDRHTDYYIVPAKSYKPNDPNMISDFASERMNLYLDLIYDEYERIKNRVEFVNDELTDSAEIRNYAAKNIQKTKKLIEDAKVIFSSLSITDSFDNLHILLITTETLIKIISFLQNHLKFSINFQVENTDSMLLKLYKQIHEMHFKCLKNENLEILCENAMIHYENSVNNKSLKKSLLMDTTKRLFQDYHSQEITKIEGNMKWKWNGQLNTLVDIIIQLQVATNPDGTRVLEVSADQIKTFLCDNFTDKHGKDLSTYTLATYLKPYRSDKKIKKDNPKRIDLSSHFDQN
ncbi:MAG: hypothetical protein ISR55_12515 [Bacteroidetes bacterium]|nr:hypothetical protein [Bacteroidota bacterium]